MAIYEKEGEDGVLNFAQEKLEPMLYNEGQAPQLIKWADYLRWKKSINVILGIVEEEQISETNSYFREHEAQTRLNKRGVEGETVVHLLLNRKEPMCREIARILITKYSGMAKDIYLGEQMFGQSALHLAIVHEDFEMVHLLLEMGSSVNARATGDFFMPEEYEKNDPKSMDYKGNSRGGGDEESDVKLVLLLNEKDTLTMANTLSHLLPASRTKTFTICWSVSLSQFGNCCISD